MASVNDRVVPSFREVFQYWRTIIRSGVIGTFIGIIPGVGEDVGAWSSYAAARRFSKKPEEFGKGSQEGLIAAETGDNAVIPGAMIPTLTLAIPGSAASAVLIAAMFIHGIRPGPMLMIENPTFLYQIVAMLLLATVMILAYGLSLTRLFIKVLLVPRERLMAVVYVLCLVGAFAITQRMFDVYVMLFFGIVGFLLREMKYPMAPLVLGIILGDLDRREPAPGTPAHGWRPVALLHSADLAGAVHRDPRLGRPERPRRQAADRPDAGRRRPLTWFRLSRRRDRARQRRPPPPAAQGLTPSPAEQLGRSLHS